LLVAAVEVDFKLQECPNCKTYVALSVKQIRFRLKNLRRCSSPRIVDRAGGQWKHLDFSDDRTKAQRKRSLLKSMQKEGKPKQHT
jgi:hypothetical protein